VGCGDTDGAGVAVGASVGCGDTVGADVVGLAVGWSSPSSIASSATTVKASSVRRFL